MRKKNFKGRCEKRVLSKCEGVCRTYDAIQFAYADRLEADDSVREIRVNVPLDGVEEGEFRKLIRKRSSIVLKCPRVQLKWSKLILTCVRCGHIM